MFQKLLETLSLALGKRAVDYMVIGGQALLLYGEPRLTKDIDVTLGVDTDRLKDILELAGDLRWKVLVDGPEAFVKQTKVLPCQEPASGIRIDFIFSFSAYEKEALRRVRRVSIGRSEVCFASPEDLVIHKIVAGRPRDLEDVRTVFLKNPALDVPYIRRWLGQFGATLSRPVLKSFEEIQRSVS